METEMLPSLHRFEVAVTDEPRSRSAFGGASACSPSTSAACAGAGNEGIFCT